MSIFIAACIGVARLQADPARVVHHALADQRQVADRRRRSPAGSVSLIMRGGSSLPALTPEQAAAARARRARRSSNTSISRPSLGGELASRCRPSGVAVRWPGGVLARSRASCAARGDDPSALAPRLDARRRGRRGDERQLASSGGARAFASSARRSGSGRAARPRRRPAPRVRRHAAASASVVASRACLPAARANAAAASRSRAPRRAAPLADADGDHARPALAGHDERLAHLAFEPGRGQRCPVEAELPRAPRPSGRRARRPRPTPSGTPRGDGDRDGAIL